MVPSTVREALLPYESNPRIAVTDVQEACVHDFLHTFL